MSDTHTTPVEGVLENYLSPVLEIPRSGVVRMADWAILPATDAGLCESCYVFCRHWQVITDSRFPVHGFKSTEKWQLIGYKQDGTIGIVIPGCKVHSFVAHNNPPSRINCGVIE